MRPNHARAVASPFFACWTAFLVIACQSATDTLATVASR
jgi:hypothetical protein